MSEPISTEARVGLDYAGRVKDAIRRASSGMPDQTEILECDSQDGILRLGEAWRAAQVALIDERAKRAAAEIIARERDGVLVGMRAYALDLDIENEALRAQIAEIQGRAGLVPEEVARRIVELEGRLHRAESPTVRSAARALGVALARALR